MGLHGPLVDPPGTLVEPLAIFFSKLGHQSVQGLLGQVSQRVDAQELEALIGLGADAIEFLTRQGLEHLRDFAFYNDGDAIGLVEFAGQLGQQFIGCHTDGARESSRLKNGFLDQSRHHTPAFSLTPRHIAQVEKNFIDPTVFHDGANVLGNGLETR